MSFASEPKGFVVLMIVLTFDRKKAPPPAKTGGKTASYTLKVAPQAFWRAPIGVKISSALKSPTVDSARKSFRRRATVWLLLAYVCTLSLFRCLAWWIDRVGTHHHVVPMHGVRLYAAACAVATAAACGIIFSPLIAAYFYIFRKRKRLLLWTLSRSTKPRESELEDERHGLFWTVPKSAEIADAWKLLLIVPTFYIATFIAVALVFGTLILIEHIIPPLQRADQKETLFGTAFKCANLIGVAIPTMWVVLLAIAPRTRTILTPAGLVNRLGSMRKLITYDSIRMVQIETSPKRQSLSCFAVSYGDPERLKCERFTFGPDAPVAEIIAAFAAREIPVEDVR